jgi:hypothetical protein
VEIVPITQADAFAFIERHHRHHGKPFGALFQIAAAENGEIVGVCVIGRPIARLLEDGYTAEVLRLCTTGERNACSMLLAAAWRTARAMGYRRLVTYTLPEEGGASLRAAGWKLIGEAGGPGKTNRAERARRAANDAVKHRWEAPGSVTDIEQSRDAQNVRKRCEVCGRGIALIGVRGKRRDARFCGDRCRQRAHRKRKRAA